MPRALPATLPSKSEQTVTAIEAIAAGISKAEVPRPGRGVAELYHLVSSRVVTHKYWPFVAFYDMPNSQAVDLFFEKGPNHSSIEKTA